LDVVIALVWLVALEADALTSVHISGPRWFNVAAVGVAALAAIGRRQHPMTYLIVVGVCSAALTNGLTSSDYATVTGVYSVLIPTYTIGAWLPRRRGLQLMCVWVVCAELLIAATGPTVSGTIGPLLAGGVAFAAGLVMRSQRELIVSLREASRRLVDERADRERLAVASERARLTRDLHETVAGGVTAMVVQAEAALNMMARDPDSTHESLSAVDSITSIETSGREVLVQLRHILGVLRHGGGAKQLTPQPGLGEVHQLLERSREQGRPVDFRVVGDPGNLLAGLDMATYRILEDVLEDPGWDQGESLTVTLRFSDRDVEIDLCTGSPGGRSWPALAIRQRVAMFNGDVHLSSRDDATSQMIIRLPRVIEGALA
jgi:signal transduction histidine kinase